MRRWSQTADGWAVNLDGTDAALVFALPRVELHSSPRGWRSTCHLADGRRSEWTLPGLGGATAAMADALARAERLLAPAGLAAARAPHPPVA
jgi:hypothetical protein